MASLSDAAVAQFARVYAEAVVAYLARRDDEQVFINYSLDDGVFYWDATDEGIAGDDVDLLIMSDWQRHTGPIDLPLDRSAPGYLRQQLCEAIEAAVIQNGFAARIAWGIRATAIAEAAEARACDPLLH